MPTHNQSQTKRMMIYEPFHLKIGALSFGKCRDDGLHIALLARLGALALGKSKVMTALIEGLGVQDRLEFVGHAGTLLLIYPTFLWLIEGFWGLDGACLQSPKFP